MYPLVCLFVPGCQTWPVGGTAREDCALKRPECHCEHPNFKNKKQKKLNNLTDELKVMRERVKANVPNAAVLSLSTGAPGRNLQTFLVLFEASGAF